MLRLERTNSENRSFKELVKVLDSFLAEIDGDEHSFYSQLNKTGRIRHVVVAYENEVPVACGAIREFDAKTMEVKRMFVLPESRGKGIATAILSELEKWTKELSICRCVLETGKRQPEAIRLYQKNGYLLIPNYGQYTGVENSMCFEKVLI